MKHLNNYITEKFKINSKTVYEKNNNQFLNKEITPDNFKEENFTSEESEIIKDLLKDYKRNLCKIYLVDGNEIPDDVNIRQYFGTTIPKDKKGILYIEKESSKMGAEEYAVLYEIK